MSSKHRELTVDDKIEIYCFLLEHMVNGRLKHGALSKAVQKFKCDRTTIWRVRKAVSKAPAGTPLSIALKLYTSSRGRKKTSPEKLESSISSVHMNRRKTYRSLSRASGIPVTTLWEVKKRGDMKRQRADPKPVLTRKHKLRRVKYALPFVASEAPDFKFHDMLDQVHVDEKWFWLMKVNQSYLLLSLEKVPQRKTRSKRYITKVMFLAAVAKPRTNPVTGEVFDGKLGVWPFIEQVPAQGNSRNRPKGTLETKPLNVTKEVYQQFIVEKVIPAIKEKMGFMKGKRLNVHQDNAKPHIPAWDEDVFEAGTSDGWNIRLRNQPANSPEFNVLDLGYFNSNQSLQQEECADNIDALVTAVENAFSKVTASSLFDNFITLQAVMKEVMKSDGDNDIKIPHLRKQAHRRAGNVLTHTNCDSETILQANTFIDSCLNA